MKGVIRSVRYRLRRAGEITVRSLGREIKTSVYIAVHSERESWQKPEKTSLFCGI